MVMTPSALTQLLERIETAAAKRFPATTSWHSRPVVSAEERLQAAEALRARLCCVPFYAKGAEKAKQAGDEMAYWLQLQSSQATAHRR